MITKAQKDKDSYKKLLPARLTVYIHKTDEGFWAKIKEIPCYTQASSFPELIDMINDAIFTHFEIPIKHRKGLGYYAPKELVDEIKRLHIQEMVREMIGEKLQKTSVFELNPAVS